MEKEKTTKWEKKNVNTACKTKQNKTASEEKLGEGRWKIEEISEADGMEKWKEVEGREIEKKEKKGENS